MRKIKIATLVILCVITVGLCGILAYGMTGHDIHMWGYNYISYGSPQLVLEKEVPLDGIDSISVQYDMNSNDIYLYASEGSSLTIKEYNDAELTADEISTVKVSGSSLEIKGKRRKVSYIRFGFFSAGTAGGYTEIGLPSSYKGALTLTTSSGDIDSNMDILLEKDFAAETSSGDINIPNVNVPNASLSCSSGKVQVETISTDGSSSNGEINIATTSGDIDVDQMTGKINVGSSSGDITVGRLTGATNIGSSSGCVQSESILGEAQIATTSGDITVGCIDGDAEVGTSSGWVRIYEGSGERRVKTTSGDILLDGVDDIWNIETSSGGVQLKASKGSGEVHSTSGDIDLDLGELTGNMNINSSSGYVRLRLSPDNSFDFDADTSSGDINTFFDDDLSFSKKGNNAHGTYGNNVNGNSIQIGTTSGDVQVTD